MARKGSSELRDHIVSGGARSDALTTAHKPASTTVQIQGQRQSPRRLGQIPGGRHGLAPEAVAASQRERILAGMIDAVTERSYDDARISDVIASAGVSRKTFYQQFESKDECFAEAYGEAMDRLVDVTLSAFGDEGPWVPRLRGALTALLAALASNPVSARLCCVEVLAAGPVAAERRREALRRLLPLLEGAPAEARLALPFAESLSLGRLGDLAEVLHQEIASGATTTLPRLVPELTYMMVLPFLGPERAAQELDGSPLLQAS